MNALVPPVPRLPFALAAALVLTSMAASPGSATIGFSSTIGATNVRGDGAPMGSEFTFEIGTFTDGFEPSADNTADWLAHWAPLSDAAADPIPESAVAYESRELPPPFPAGTTAAGFSGEVVFDHNEPPFQAMGAVFIWGYDNRTEAGAGEWILVTSSTWGWPVATANYPAVSFSIGDADTVVLGAVNGDGFHMLSAGVAVEAGSAPQGYGTWLAEHFSAGDLADPEQMETLWGVLADPDRDGAANVIEYFAGSDPRDAGAAASAQASIEGEHFVFRFDQSKAATGVEATVEWTRDMLAWRTDSVELAAVEDLGTHLRIEARVPLAVSGRDAFARLNVRRDLD